MNRDLGQSKLLFTFFQTERIIIYQTLIEICMESFWYSNSPESIIFKYKIK